MVGLKELGEAAWGMEQTLNHWLQLEWQPTPALQQLIEDAHALFSGWVAQLEGGGSTWCDASQMVATAERMRESQQPIVDVAELAAPASDIPATAEAADEGAVEAPVAEQLADEPPAMVDDAVQAAEMLQPEAFELSLGDAAEDAATQPEPIAESVDPVASAAEDVPPSIASDAAPPGETDLGMDELNFDLAPDEVGDGEAGSDENSLESADQELDEVESLAEPVLDTPLDQPVLIEPEARQASDLEGPDNESTAPESAAEEAPAQETAETTDATDDTFLPQTASPHSGEIADSPDNGAEMEEISVAALDDFADEDLELDDAVEALDPGPVAHGPEAGKALELAPDEAPGTWASEPAVEATTAESAEDGATDAFLNLEDDSDAMDLGSIDGDLEDMESAPASLADESAEQAQPEFVSLGGEEISRPLFDMYVAEARQHVAHLRHELARLHANPTLLPPESSIRAAHTLAGISGTAHIEAVQMLARALEHAQNRLHQTAQPPTAEQADVLSATASTLEAMVAQVAELTPPLAVPELVEQLEGIARPPMADLLPFGIDRAAPRQESVAPGAEPPATHAEAEEEAALVVRDEIDESLLPIFLEEAHELLDQLGSTLRTWREAPAAAEQLEAMARLLHTLKGSARMAGAMNMGEFVHRLESHLESSRDRADAKLIDDIEAGLDESNEILNALARGETTAEPTGGAATGAGVEIDQGASGTGDVGSAVLRLRADTVDRFVNSAGEIGISRTRIEGELRTVRRSLLDLTENVIRLRNQLREVEIQADVQMQSRIAQAESHHSDFDPLEMDRYTRLQELTRMMAESVGDVTTVQQNLLRNLDGAEFALNSQARLSRDLQQALMRVRMVRFDSLAERLYRVVRQSAKDLGKRANLDLRGGTIEIDRGVLDHMTAPLEHLLRNAVAHGIEMPDSRRDAGKAEIGQITLTVRQEGNEIAIDLADDGAGLDYERIRDKACRQGLLAADEEADERRLTNLIFVPGFSTAGNVSTISGRGVGMDVVKSETAAVGGRIDVTSEAGLGTRFRVYLPLTLAVTQALLIRSGNRSYAIPSTMVAQVLELKPHALAQIQADGSTTWMGQQFSYQYLPRLLGDQITQPEVHRFNWVLLLRAGAQTLALHVDGLRGNQEIVVKNAGPQLARIVGISGATVLGDGEIVLIINPVALASRRPVAIDGDTPQAAPEAEIALPTIMVVDDSLTVRKITSRLLEREGYRVVTAKDGVDALEKLIDTRPDVILSDIEMPRMDGFDLVRNIRADAALKGVPVIMITSRLADKHRRYAQEIGANHYLGKPYQEDELLGLIAGYTGREEAMAMAVMPR
jgi:chemosensory pili system protein ChpA (sensor histidine kinase/response regulator)